MKQTISKNGKKDAYQVIDGSKRLGENKKECFELRDNKNFLVQDSCISEWRELYRGKNEFQEILKVLINKHKNPRNLNTDSKNDSTVVQAWEILSQVKGYELQIYIHKIQDYVYQIIASLPRREVSITSTWIHEDVIAFERTLLAEETDHYVHSAFCLEDIYKRYVHTIEEEQLVDNPSVFNMMQESTITNEEYLYFSK